MSDSPQIANASYLDSILQQPDVLLRIAETHLSDCPELDSVIDRLRAGEYRHVLLTGIGTSLYCSYPLWLSLSSQPVPSSMWDTSELIHFGAGSLRDDTLLIVISQSGESAEIRHLADLGQRPALVLAVTNSTGSSLAQWADVVLDMQAGEEAAVSTKTYVASLAVLYLLGCKITGQDLAAATKNLQQAAAAMNSFLQDWEARLEAFARFVGAGDSLALLGRGRSLATALTGSLILKEASKVFTTALSSGQFRHGPLELARPGFKAVILAGEDETRTLNERLAHDIARHGGEVLMVTVTSPGEDTSGVMNLIIPPVAPELLPIMEIVPLQALAIPFARTRGFQAGVFEHGTKVTTSE